MTDNRQIQSNAVSDSSDGPVDSVEEGICKMKIEKVNGGDEEKGDDTPPYPDRPGEPDCMYYLRTGLCGYGSKCRFNHPVHPPKSVQSNGELPERDGQPDCGFYLKTGTCKYGSSCKFHHPKDRIIAGQVLLNTLGLPIRQEAKSCPYYMRNFTCKFGATCKFNHPQLASAETVLPVPGASVFGTTGASVFPPMAMPYAGGLSAWVLPRPQYLSGQRVAAPQTYASIAVPPSQGVVAPQSWNTYMGTVPPANIYGTNYYNANDQEGPGIGHFPLTSVKNSRLPDRPDQPECRYFMSTGSCKYGSDCKYHHPKERVSPLAIYGLGPHGLPLRPGEAMCGYFHTYGVCKYGSTCKFDHPISGYVSGYGFSLPPVPVSILAGQPLTSYHQRNSPATNYAATSPSKSSKTGDWMKKAQAVEKKESVCPDVKQPSEGIKEAVNSEPPYTLTPATSE